MQKAMILALLLACGTAQAESIPLVRDNGTYLVPILINDKITLKFTIDSGAADVSIPADVFSTLVRAETISKADMLDKRVYVLADGREHNAQRFRIRSLRLGNVELRDIVGSVAPAEGSLLLGQSFLEKFSYWGFDNQNHLMIINEVPSPVATTPPVKTSKLAPSAPASVATHAHSPTDMCARDEFGFLTHFPASLAERVDAEDKCSGTRKR